MKKHTSKHHLCPKSRNGKGKKTVTLPIDFHQAWHKVFGNLKPEEMPTYLYRLMRMMDEHDTITYQMITKMQEDTKANRKKEREIIKKPWCWT
jgi:hypothetical protein